MKQLIPFMTLYLSSSVTVADSLRMRWLQTYQFSSDRDLTFSCSVMVEDIEVLAAYNDTWLIVFKQSWSKGNFSETEWMFYNMFLSSYLYYLDIHVDEIGKEVGLKGAFTLQCWTECPSSADDIDGYSYRVAVDGVDLVYLNITERAWVAGNSPYSQAIREIMQKDPITLRSLENGLNKHCQSLAAAYATTGREAFSRKVQPQVYLVRKPLLSKTEILCMVTGFYPKPINVSLWRENKMEDGMSTETLPNGDSTYQITVMTTANLFEEEHFSCHVEHISLQEPLIVRLSSIKIRWLQNYQFSNNLEVFTLWSTLLVEDIETLSVNNDTRIIKFKQSWSKGNLPDADWFIYGMFLTNYMYYFQKHIYDISIEFRFRGDFRIQCWMEIPSSEDDMKGYILKLALEGMDLMYFNVTTESWLAYHTPYSEAIEKFLQNDNVTRASFAASMKNQMHSLAVLYATTGKESFSRKIQPEAYITTRRVFSGTEVLCWATGFYPKPINVSLWKQNKMVDGVLTETLPNGDDTYQITMVASTRWTGEENIYCRVEHSSFKEPLIVQLDKRHSHTLIAVISVMVVAVVVGLTLFMLHHKKRRQYTSIALGRLS